LTAWSRDLTTRVGDRTQAIHDQSAAIHDGCIMFYDVTARTREVMSATWQWTTPICYRTRAIS
jgi:hypothetical protein